MFTRTQLREASKAFCFFGATFSCPLAGADEALTKIGAFSPYKDLPNVHQIWVIADRANVIVRVNGSESFAMSNCPEIWCLEGSRVSPGYIFQEQHGLKIRFTQPVMQPKDLSYDVHIYSDGKFWKVNRDCVQELLESTDMSKLAEIKRRAIWFAGHKLCELPEQGVSGNWYSDPKLEIVLAENFHDELILSLDHGCESTLSDWKGKQLQLRLNDHATIKTGELATDSLRIHAVLASTVDVKSVVCDKFDASAEGQSHVMINAGHINSASTGEIFGGKIEVLAKIANPEGQSTNSTNTQKIIHKQTPQGTILEFPKYGNFELK